MAMNRTNNYVTSIAFPMLVAMLVMAIFFAINVLQHSNKDHSPDIEGTTARRVINTFITAWANFTTNGGGKDPRENCGVVKDATGTIVKIAFSVVDSISGNTFTLWFWEKTPGKPWGGAYPKEITGPGSFEDGPKDDLKKPGWTWSVGPDICQQFGNNVPRLQPAQPGSHYP